MYTNIIHVKTTEQYFEILVLLENLGYLWSTGIKPTEITSNVWNNHKDKTHIFIDKQRRMTYGPADLADWGGVKISSHDFIEKMKPKPINLNRRIISILEGELSGK